MYVHEEDDTLMDDNAEGLRVSPAAHRSTVRLALHQRERVRHVVVGIRQLRLLSETRNRIFRPNAFAGAYIPVYEMGYQ